MLESASSTRTKLPQPRKPELFNTKVVHKVNFRSPSSKVATFQLQSSTRSALPQLQLTSRKPRMRGPVGLMSANWRGGPSTFAKLSRILRQTFAKIRLEVALSLPRQLQNSQKLVSAGWGLLLQRRILAATLRLRILRPTLLCGHSARAQPVVAHGSSLQLPVSKPHKTFAEKELTFATPFAELSQRSTLRPKGRPLHSSIQRPFGLSNRRFCSEGSIGKVVVPHSQRLVIAIAKQHNQMAFLQPEPPLTQKY